MTDVEDMHAYPIGVDFLNGEWGMYTSDGKSPFYDAEPTLSVIEE